MDVSSGKLVGRAARVLLVLAAGVHCPMSGQPGVADNGSSGAGGSSSGLTSGNGSSGNGVSSGNGGSSGGGASSGSGVSSTSGSGGASSTSGGGVSSSSSGGVEYVPVVYGHSSTNLFRLDVSTLQVEDLGEFEFVESDGSTPSLGHAMTDLAVDREGTVYGCSYSALFRVDLPSLRAVKLVELDDEFNGLSFLPAGQLDPTQEVLVGSTLSPERSLYRIDVQTGVATLLGPYGDDWYSSGDVVAILHDAAYAIIKRDGDGDHLAVIKPADARATVIGDGIGHNDVWGVGYWNGVLYGFTSEGKVVAIDRTTGVGTLVTTLPVSFWGAGVTTLARIPDPPDGGVPGDAGECTAFGESCVSDADCCAPYACLGSVCGYPG
ncbi:MAG: hypothetical protein AB2A00_09050 [Myxococcota bacterium]